MRCDKSQPQGDPTFNIRLGSGRLLMRTPLQLDISNSLAMVLCPLRGALQRSDGLHHFFSFRTSSEVHKEAAAWKTEHWQRRFHKILAVFLWNLYWLSQLHTSTSLSDTSSCAFTSYPTLPICFWEPKAHCRPRTSIRSHSLSAGIIIISNHSTAGLLCSFSYTVWIGRNRESTSRRSKGMSKRQSCSRSDCIEAVSNKMLWNGRKVCQKFNG